jgi:ribosomal protein S12 methylthiotransferase accessory factor
MMRPGLVSDVFGPIWRVDWARHCKTDPEVFACAATAADLESCGIVNAGTIAGSGAGYSRDEALRAAQGEFAERYCLAQLSPEDTVTGSYQELVDDFPGTPEPSRWALFSEAQHPTVPFAPFRRDTPLAWLRGRALCAGLPALVPACLVNMPYHPRAEGEQVVGFATSTGAASWTTWRGACLRGLLECIERDAFTIAWRNRLTLPRIRVDEESSLHAEYVRRFRRPGIQLRLYHSTLDLELPSVLGVVVDERRTPPATMCSGASAPTIAAAVRKTLVELSQGIKWMEHIRLGDREFAADYSDVHTFEDHVRLYCMRDMSAHVAFLEGGGERRLSELERREAGAGGDPLTWCLEVMRARGLEALALDRSTVDVVDCGLRVAKVVVPAFEQIEGNHRWPCLGGRRWRDVPVALELRRAPATEAERNPVPHPYP